MVLSVTKVWRARPARRLGFASGRGGENPGQLLAGGRIFPL